MSLEQAILAHAEALNKLAAAINAKGAGVSGDSPVSSDKPTRGRASSADKAVDPAKAETPATPAKTEAPAADKPKTIDEQRAAAKALVLKVVGTKGREAATAALAANHEGATNVTTMPDEKIGALITALEKALA